MSDHDNPATDAAAARVVSLFPADDDDQVATAGPVDDGWVAAGAAAAAATLRALADQLDTAGSPGARVIRRSDRVDGRPCARYEITMTAPMPVAPPPLAVELDVCVALSQEEMRRLHRAGWPRDRVIPLGAAVHVLNGLRVQNVYVSELAAEHGLPPELVSYLQHVQRKTTRHGVIRSLSGGLSWTPLA